MSVTAEQIAQLRRMIDEPTDEAYTDSLLTWYIEGNKITDESGRFPMHADWAPTYDLNATASVIWEEKAAVLSNLYTHTADGVTLNRAQMFQQASKMAQRFRSRSAITPVMMSPLRTVNPLEVEMIAITEQDITEEEEQE